MNEFMKKVRKEIKKGVTVEGGYGPGFIVKSKAKFVSEKNWAGRFYIKVDGPAFSGRVYIIERAKIPGKPETYNVRFKKPGAKFYYTVKYFKDVHPGQLTAVLDALVFGTGEVNKVEEETA